MSRGGGVMAPRGRCSPLGTRLAVEGRGVGTPLWGHSWGKETKWGGRPPRILLPQSAAHGDYHRGGHQCEKDEVSEQAIVHSCPCENLERQAEDGLEGQEELQAGARGESPWGDTAQAMPAARGQR